MLYIWSSLELLFVMVKPRIIWTYKNNFFEKYGSTTLKKFFICFTYVYYGSSCLTWFLELRRMGLLDQDQTLCPPIGDTES